MSQTDLAIKNKHQKQSKVNYQAYLINPNEPMEHIPDDIHAELEAELLENNVPMRQKIRYLARRMRSRNA